MRPIGIEMIAAAPVMRIVPTIAWSAPPPSPTTLRIDELKNMASKRLMPLTTTVHATETSGTMAIRNAAVTTPVTRRSTALRRLSTMAEIVKTSTR